ncbi:MAG: hypothetical protein ACN4G0_00865, partial [Polyangiales bacterium]
MDSWAGRTTRECVEIDHPWFSNDLMPLYRWTFPPKATDEELAACLRAREDLAAHARYYMAWVIDMSNITKAPATQRKALAQHLKRFDEYGVRYNAGSAIVVPSPWLRGLVTAVTWISPPRFP